MVSIKIIIFGHLSNTHKHTHRTIWLAHSASLIYSSLCTNPLFQYTQSTLNKENYENVFSHFKNI